MKENYIKKLYSKRIAQVSGDIKKENATKKPQKSQKFVNVSQAVSILDLSADEPDAMPDFFVTDTLYKESSKWENRGGDNKAHEILNESAANYLCNFLGAQRLDANEELCAISGVEAGLLSLSLSFINSGDAAVIAGIPGDTAGAFGNAVKWSGGVVLELPPRQKSKFPKFEDIPQKSLKKTKLIYINYPNELTGQLATQDFFKEAVEFARLNNLIIVNDASFASLTYSEDKRISFLSVEGAKKVGAELHGFKHGFNMTGWQTGFIAGNKSIIRAVREIDAKCGRAVSYAPMLCASAYALSRTDIPISTAKKYERRAALIARLLETLGFKLKKPKAGCFLFVKAPKSAGEQIQFSDSYEFEEFLLSRGIKAKAYPDGYMRFSLTFSAFGHEEEQAVAGELYERLKDCVFVF